MVVTRADSLLKHATTNVDDCLCLLIQANPSVKHVRGPNFWQTAHSDLLAVQVSAK